MRRLSVVLPAHDEAHNIVGVVHEAGAVCAALHLDYEIIVVDDGSTDGTLERVRPLAGPRSRVRLVCHGENRGYGAALRTGIRRARGEHVFFTDADRQFDLAELPRLLHYADRFDIVIGYRDPRADSLVRRLNGWGWGWLNRCVYGLRVRDVNCAFKLFHRRVFHDLDTASIGAFVNAEILVRAGQRGYRVREVPVSHYPRRRGDPSGNRPGVVLRALVEMACHYPHLARKTGGRVA